jgi:hypothetical protein
MESGFHLCCIEIGVPHLCCWHLYIFFDGGKEKDSSHFLTVAELWMFSSESVLVSKCRMV